MAETPTSTENTLDLTLTFTPDLIEDLATHPGLSDHCAVTGVNPLKATDGITYSDSSTIAIILNDQFSSVFNKDEDTSTIKDTGPSPINYSQP